MCPCVQTGRRMYGPGGVRDPALDETQDIKAAWLEASMQVFAEATDPQMRHRYGTAFRSDG